ncbi:MAG: diaminopimelate decarboxylase [Planctomycetes bacterium]|nr:diaminopimelate decarboxylase [Planctomycetota bacterium]
MNESAVSIRYVDRRLVVDGVDIDHLADVVGTPFHVYSAGTIRERHARITRAFDGIDLGIRYAVKACGNGAILRLLHELGAGFDLVSGGEYQRARRIGASPDKLVIAGVGKREDEIRSVLREGIGVYHVESEAEFDLLSKVVVEMQAARALHGGTLRVALRLNPDVGVDTHDYIATAKKESKFGIDFQTAARLVERIAEAPGLDLCAYHVHLGSLLFEVGPYLEACRKVLAWMDEEPLRSQGVTHYDMGGGFGSGGPFSDAAIDLAALGHGMKELLSPRGLSLLCEPGRFLVGDSGLLVTSLLYEKCGMTKDFYVVDAAMTDLIRPSLYGATHDIRPVIAGGRDRSRRVDVVGPVCESGDWLGKDRELPQLDAGARLAVLQSGAYGMSMASNYNTRPKAAEVLCDSGRARLISRHQPLEDLWRDECDVAVEGDFTAR